MEPGATNREFKENKPEVIIKNDKDKTFLLLTVAVPSMRVGGDRVLKKQLKYKSFHNI